jgi:hypothetical protein
MASSPNSGNRNVQKGVNKVARAGRSKKSRASTSGRIPKKGMPIAPATPRGGKESIVDPRHRVYGGELVISGDMDDRKRSEIMGTIKHIVEGSIGRTAKKAEVRTEKDRIVVLTAESQPAVALGKKLHHAHKGGRLKIVWSDNDAPVRVHWTTGE